MKQIKIVIRPEKLNDVRDALVKIGCFNGVMISEITGHGSQKGLTQTWRGEKYTVEFIPKMCLIMVVEDKDVDKIKKAILESAPTGDPGDGKIFISNVEEVIRIRTGEEGPDAL
jgi:nitrogen regulatory protein P-II 1